MGIELKTPAQLAHMERAGHIVESMLAVVRAAIAPGVRTDELDALAHEHITKAGAHSNFLGYYGYPATICISVNEQVVHGIPGDYRIREGDVVSVDGGCYVNDEAGKAWHSDSAFSLVVGEGSEADHGLVNATETALWAAIAALAGERRVGAVGQAVEATLERHRKESGQQLAVVPEYVGHGIGTKMHMAPEVPNFRSRGRGLRLKPGAALAIEPIIAAGSPANDTLSDEWTVITTDGSRAAHWEHSVAILDSGVRVLTASDGGQSGLAAYGITPAPLA